MRRSYELWAALTAMVAVTAVYWLIGRNGMPRAGGVAGHSIGILGFLLMLSTETLYSLRKRARRRVPGRMSTWLGAHIFTGIVGTYMVLLHTAWRFNGLAGATMLMAAVVVASGFVGRYIYTRVPRTADGADLAMRDLEARIVAAEAEIQTRSASWPALAMATAGSGTLPGGGNGRSGRLEDLVRERDRLRRQMDSLAAARRLLALWYTIHIPLGVVLFTLAFIHIAAALYYATLLR